MDNERERRKVKQFIVALLQLAPDKTLTRAHIGKAYYYANRFAMEQLERFISTHRCVVLPWGHGIDEYKEIFKELQTAGVIEMPDRKKVKLCTTESVPCFPKEELECIRAAYEEVQGKTFQELSEESHKQKSWKGHSISSSIDFFDDILSDEEIRHAKKLAKKVPSFSDA